MPGVGRPAIELDQAVVAPSSADGLLLALASGDVELECRPCVVVEPADQPWFEPLRVQRGYGAPGRRRNAPRRRRTTDR